MDINSLDFFSKYRKPMVEGLPKYAVLREVMNEAIMGGHWNIGDQLPSEAELVDLTKFSLGTVQKAMRELVNAGVIERRQGQGTFVSGNRAQMHDTWHFRFYKDGSNGFLPVYPEVLTKKQTSSDEPWAERLTQGSGQLIQIERKLNIGDEFCIFSQFYLSADKYQSFISLSNSELESNNFKTILKRYYGTAIHNMSYALQIISLPKDICRIIGLSSDALGSLVEIMADSRDKVPVYYQRLYLPPSGMKMFISDSTTIPEYWR